MLRLLPLLLLALLVTAAPASAAKPRCAKNTILIGPKKQPRACLPKTLPAASPTLLKSLVKGKPDRRLEKLAVAQFRARAAKADDLPDGVEMTVKDGVVELRDRTGASYAMGLDKANTVPACPKADGAVPAKLDETFTFGFGTVTHGKRTWTLITMRNEATWTGHVGVGAKAETIDVAFRGELSIKSGVEIAATGKVLKRNPTRTYRSALTKQGLPVGFDPMALAKELTLRGPKGTRAAAGDLEAATRLFTTSLLGLMEVQYALEKGDERWYVQRSCATTDFSSSPEKVVKGGRGDWTVRVLAQDGARAADARWTAASGCGALTASSTSGSEVSLSVADSASAWGPPTAGACATAEITSTAGRPRAFDHSIPPLEAKRYLYDIIVDFGKEMGSQVAPTVAAGVGKVTAGPGDGLVEGTGEFFGREWDSGPLNTCGEDMLRSRQFNSPAAVAAEVQGDEVTIGFTAIERPFDAAWIVTVPVTGGKQSFASYQPFCGDPTGAFRWADIVVLATPVS